MEEIKMENVLNEVRVRGESLRNALDKVNAHVSDILVFNVQWKDLNEYLESVNGKVEERLRELKGQSFALEERAKVVEEAEAKLADLEAKSNAEDVRLSHLRTLVEECEAEKMLKESELSEMVRKTHVELGLKGEELAKMETDLEKCRGDVSTEMESLSRTQTHRRQLDEEVGRKTKDLTLVQNKLAECEQLLETSSSELFKIQDELECKRQGLGQMEADLERCRDEVSAEMESLSRAQTQRIQLDEEVERKTKDLTLVQNKLGECEKLFETRSSELIKTQSELGLKGEELEKMETDLEKCRGDVSTEMESLSRTQTYRRHLDEEVGRKTKDLTSVQNKLAECEQLLETSSSELFKIQDELECKREHLGQMEINLERHRVKVRIEMESLRGAQTHMRQLVEEVERKTKDLTSVQNKLAECEQLLETSSSELFKMQDELERKREDFRQMEIDLERHCVKVSAEMESLRGAQTHMRQLVEEVERKTKGLYLVRTKLLECEKLVMTSSSKLIKTQGELECKQEQLGEMEADFQMHHAKVIAEKELWVRTQSHSRELEEEIERKRKDLTMVLDKIAGCGRQLESMEEQLDSQQKLLETQSSELVTKEKELQELSLEIDLREQTVISLNDDMEETCQQMESKAKELENVQTLIKERSAHCESLKLFIKKLSKKQDSAENEVDWTEKKLDSTTRHLERCIAKHKSKKKELRSVQSILSEIKEQVEEGEKRMQYLNSSSEELNSQLRSKQEEVSSISGELKAKRKHHDQVQSSILDHIAELNFVKQKIQDSLKDFQSKEEEQARLRASLMEREQGLELKEKEISAREERIDNKAQQLKSAALKLAKSSKKTEPKSKKQGNTVQRVDLVRNANVCDEKTLQLLLRGHLKKRDQLHLDVLFSVKRSSDPAKLVLDTINGLYSAHQRTALKNLDPKSVQRSSIFLLECLIDMSPKPKTQTQVQGEAIKFATEWKNTSLVNAENPVEVLEFLHFLAAFSLAYTFDADKDQNLFDVAFLRKYGPSLCNALGVSALAPVNNVLSLEDKPKEQLPEAPMSNSVDSRSSDVQQNITSSDLPNEDTLRDFDGSTSFSPNEVFTKLPVFKSPGRFVLNAVEDALTDARLRGELSLKEPILMPLVPLLEELARVGIPTNPGLQNDATKVAHRWVKMMGASSVAKSQREVWAFLQFIVAFGLVKRTKRDETLKLASYVAHFKHAPKLFQSLGLSDAIPSFVTQLLDKAIYIPAIRFMFYFNVEKRFSPLELLKEQIISLSCSAKEKRRYESQAEEANRDGATLREMIELIEDFQLEIDIPVAIILKFMVPREIASTSSVPAQSTHMQASETDIQSSCIATHGLDPSLPTSFGSSPTQPAIDAEMYQDQPVNNVEAYQAGGSTAFQGQSSQQAGSKRPRIDPEGSRLVTRVHHPGLGDSSAGVSS
ncbi:unnamed protein product [Eruca vesicaria subsp. sativa]|uniref:FRIGIDA-like protein n=1 Tax=Eruca vesicaria subsp. sativa TaxID=29727 RepID=A0ABC8LT98_ERUVS|nr:unnamed protein product [Eruca vesicaria subsp. sativa]